MTALRVVYFVANFHRLTGSQKSLLLLATGFSKQDVAPLVVFPGEGACSRAYREAGVDVRVVEAPASLQQFGGGLLRTTWPERLTLAARALAPYSMKLRALIQRERADLVHLNNARSALMAGPAAIAAGKPRVYHVRSDERSLGIFSQASSLMANRIILVADALKTSVPQRLHGRCRVVHNGVAAPTSPPTRSRDTLLSAFGPPSSDALLVIVVGTITPFKGAHHAIRALTLLHEREPVLAARIRLGLVGDVPDDTYGRWLQGLIPSALRGQVAFPGWDDKPLDWMQAADTVLLPTIEQEELTIDGTSRKISGTEGFSRTVLEAMACGRPVIGSRVAGTPEQVVHEETGLLVAPSAPEELARAMSSLLSRSEKERAAMGARAGERAKRFSVASMCEKTLSVYRDLVADY